MKYADIVSTAALVLENNPKQAVMIHGAPGCGKSHAGLHGIPQALGISPDAVEMFRPSNHDPVDLSGLPMVNENHTKWSTPDFLLRINHMAQTHGKALFLLDELNQAVPMMFNTLNGLILDRRIGDFRLHDGVRIVATGNRQTDKAASNRMPSHTANRLFHMDMESDLDGWCEWALGAGIPVWIVAFLRFKPALLNDFNPDRRENPTERSWEMFARSAGDDLPLKMTNIIARGYLGEGAAAEVTAFRQVMEHMPNPDACMMDPDGSPLPESLSATYALCGALAQRAKKDNFDRLVKYVSRLAPEFGVLAVRDAYRINREIAHSRAFIEWSAANQGLI